MRTLRLSLVIGLVLCSVLAPAVFAQQPADEAIPRALFTYVQRPEPAFAWKLTANHDRAAGRVYEVELTSQVWHDITWKHDLLIHEPAELRHPRHVLLFVTGGRTGRRPGTGDLAMGSKLAELAGARVAMLFQVPNQPLLGDRIEDDLITETWLRYLDTGDETWPLLFPMVKSAVKAMDAIQALAKERWGQPVDGFVITGASKRGWTSWLTPVADPRVVATVPMVINVLNFRPQMQHQLDTWGKYSEQIDDYSRKGLIKQGEETPRERQLRRMVDPYTYRGLLPLPKLMIHGTNDRYWVVDALRFYWSDLVGPKYVLQVPNAGHGLDGGRELALGTLAVFFRHAVTATPLPQLSWTHEDGGAAGPIVLKVTSSPKPRAARLWIAQSPTKDFRDARWNSRPLAEQGETWVGKIDRPQQGHVAHYGELQFASEGLPYSLCTLIRQDSATRTMMRKLLILSLALAAALSATAASAEMTVGTGKRIITPDPLLPVSGGFGPTAAVREKRGELTARAAVFRRGADVVALVSLDLLGFPAVLGDRVRAQVPRIPAANILISATHTHSAPCCYAFPDGRGGHTGDLKYLELVCRETAAAINEALDHLSPAWLKIATAEAQGKIAYNYYASDLYDRRMSVIQAVRPEGGAILTLVNYAVHPEVLGSDAGLVSPDLVGPLCARIEAQGGGMGLFVNSAQGGMVTADNRDLERPRDPLRGYFEDARTWDECLRIGHTMADEALRIAGTASPQTDPGLFCTSVTATFPVESAAIWNAILHSPLHYPHNEDRSVTTRINLVNLGNAQILTIPGEALPNIGFYLKRKMRGAHNLLFGLTNDAFGYLLTQVDFNSFPRYEYVSRTSLGAMTGELFIKQSLALVGNSPAPFLAQ